MKKSSPRLPEHYQDLDTPIYVWNKIHETGDLSWLLHKRKKVPSKLVSLLSKAWENIYDEYLSEFGMSEKFIQIKQKEIEIAKLKIRLVLTGDRIYETHIEIAEEELMDLKQNQGKADFMTSKIAIENKFKFQVNMHTTSIREFYSYLKHLS